VTVLMIRFTVRSKARFLAALIFSRTAGSAHARFLAALMAWMVEAARGRPFGHAMLTLPRRL
jgi:hypothetical protein